MEIEYIFRPRANEFSIEKVFETVMTEAGSYDNVVILKSNVKPYRFWPFTLLLNTISYAIKSRKKRVFHITGDVQYLGCMMNPNNTVMTIHDLVMLHNENIPRRVKRMVYWLWYYIPIRRLKFITCISEATKQDLLQQFPWAKDKITVIPNPIHPSYTYHPRDFSSDCPVILHIGTKPNKNLERVVEALQGIPSKLVVVGKLSQEQERLLNENNINYTNKYAISDEEMLRTYIESDIISFPSLFEGFGMPIIEGQAIGRPVLTSNLEPMKTVAGLNTILANPESVDSIRDCFLTIINDKEQRELCVQSGLENAKRFKTDEVVREYMIIYKKIEEA